jgi:hypothetical protein
MAGSVNTSFTRNSELGISEKAKDISGREGEMVTMDIIVRQLTSRMVIFKAPEFLFMVGKLTIQQKLLKVIKVC